MDLLMPALLASWGLALLQTHLLVLEAMVVRNLMMDPALSLLTRLLNRLLEVLMNLLMPALLANWGLLMGSQEAQMKDLLSVLCLHLHLSMGSLLDRWMPVLLVLMDCLISQVIVVSLGLLRDS